MSDTSSGRRANPTRALSAAHDPFELAVRALRARERSRHEVDERLARAGLDEPTRRETLERLEHLGYLNEDRYAAERAGFLAGRGYGDAWIRHDLQGQGVDAETASGALAGLVPEVERAAAAVMGAGADRRRVAARLARKGFATESIESAFADVGEGA